MYVALQLRELTYQIGQAATVFPCSVVHDCSLVYTLSTR